MNENVKAFIEQVKADPELSAKLGDMSQEEVIAVAAAKGIVLTEEDFKLPEGELDEAEQENVAGGSGSTCRCFAAGGGGGTDSNDGNTYGCACVGYGQGGDGRADDFNCLCILTGHGYDDYY